MTLFAGDVLAKGVPDTLMTEEVTKNGKTRISFSGQFKIQEKQEAHNDRGEKIFVSGNTLTWFATLTEKTEERIRESLALCGLSKEAAQKVIDLAQSGKFGRIPERYGFHTKVVSLNCTIDEYDGKRNTKVNWINDPAGRRSKAKDAAELDLGDVVASIAGSSSQPSTDDPFA